MQIQYGAIELQTVTADAVVLLVTAADLDAADTDFKSQTTVQHSLKSSQPKLAK